jgi:hypothetical protein
LNKKEEIDENIKEIKKIIMKGSETEFEEDVEKIMFIRNGFIKNLDPKVESDKELLLYIMESNKEIEKLIEEKKKTILTQVSGLDSTKRNNKNYDLYK